MKKFIIIIVLILISVVGYLVYMKPSLAVLTPEIEKAEIEQYYIYGTTLNIKGKLEKENLFYEEIDLVLYNENLKLKKDESEEKRFKIIPIEINPEDNKVEFYISDLINTGFYLDDIEVGEYQLFLRTKHKETVDEKETIIYKYYTLDNKTEYKEITYYTMKKYNRKIEINSNNSYQTMMLNISENKDKIDVYDIVIDAGHGGMDSGAINKNDKESEYTLQISLKLKEELEKKGLKVKLTREKNSLKEDEYFNEYGPGGRAQISHEVHAKYLISIHLNKNTYSSVHGIELYTPANVDYKFAKDLVKRVVDNSSIDYSTRKTFKVSEGVYTHNFTEAEIQQSLKEYADKNYNPYNVTTNSSYLYMIRETGGIVTGAYVDNRNEKQTGNDYYNSNIGTEAYLLELAYLSNSNDLTIIKEEQDKYIKAISDSINDNFNK